MDQLQPTPSPNKRQRPEPENNNSTLEPSTKRVKILQPARFSSSEPAEQNKILDTVPEAEHLPWLSESDKSVIESLGFNVPVKNPTAAATRYQYFVPFTLVEANLEVTQTYHHWCELFGTICDPSGTTGGLRERFCNVQHKVLFFQEDSLKPHPYHGVVEGNRLVIHLFRRKPTKSDRDFEELQDNFKEEIKIMESADGKYKISDLRNLVLCTRLTLAQRQTLSIAAQVGLRVGAGAEDLDDYKRLLVQISEANRKAQNDHDNNPHLNHNNNGSADEDDLHEQDLEPEEQLTHNSYAELRAMFDDPEVREAWGDELYTAVWKAKLEEMDEDHLINLDRDNIPEEFHIMLSQIIEQKAHDKRAAVLDALDE
ncbi:hypothetical protein M438DRAFT_339948 [Aureobasidium pullulans EXF-150]|uniref:Uncharacterized protein n=1 Tax=Aureobasidium pullulans EXF-150 TaxID=1043002 RepID=A0A074X171_AURPU|nr:uncharacterized protein M438DRAFT_339948 [Aureobasidium pullulans EXF-150]KEQ79180.1 hypothetical protein M438DRAFT_339948 [Aureobasidium pullulans EXF-150]